MEKVYLLLRQNTQSGPFTLDELAHLQLLPTDLIWIEGESQSWRGPAILSDEPQKKFRGPEANDWISPRDDEGRRAPGQNGSQTSLARQATPVQSSLSGSYSAREDIELIFHKKGGATVSLVQLLGVAAVTALLALAWDNRFKLLQTREDAITYASAPEVFVPREPQSLPKPTATTFINTDSSRKQPDLSSDVQNDKKSKKKPPKPSRARTAAPVATGSVEEAEGPGMKDALPIVAPAPAETKIVDTPSTITQGNVEGVDPVKRKTLGQAIKGLFRKKNKEERKKEEQMDQ